MAEFRNPRHIHTSVRPHEKYRGLAYCYRGVSCCSFCEGEYKRADGTFDRDAAERAARTMNTYAFKMRRVLRDTASFHDQQAERYRASAANPFHVTSGV